jgi:lysophospholipase L1-like esterase
MCSDRYVPLSIAAMFLVGCSGKLSSSTTEALADSGVSAGGGTAGSGGSGPSTGGTRASGGASSSSGGRGQASGGRASGTGGSSGGNGANGSSGGSAGTPPTAEIRVVGRTDTDASPRFEWPGVSIQARFRGTSATIDIDGGDNNFFEVVIDGQVGPKISTSRGRTTIGLASGLSDAPHDLVIWRRTEALNFSPSQFFGLDFGSGTLLPASAPAHKMEVIGDSITCGYGNEGAGPGCGFTYETENNYLAYGSVAARAVGADLHTECWSGKGVYRNRDGSTDTVPTLFDKAIPTEGSSTWDFAWKPDAVVVNLGTNDFAMGDPGPGYVTAYGDFVTTIRGHYPNAYIFVMIGPITGEPDLQTTRGYLDEVVQARKSAGDSRIEQVLVDPQDGNKNGLGCDYHPSVKTHDVVGQALAAAMKKALGW